FHVSAPEETAKSERLVQVRRLFRMRGGDLVTMLRETPVGLKPISYIMSLHGQSESLITAAAPPPPLPRLKRSSASALPDAEWISRPHQPLTAPATRPLESLPCTRTKKIMTGIVMIVDAAITAPQSFECRPKN